VSAPLLRLGLVTLVFNLGGGVIAPTLPLYARSLGADYRDLGLIGAAHGLAFASLTIPLGRASDRFGRRALLLFSAVAMVAASAVYFGSTHVTGLIAGKLLEAAGWAAFWPAIEAWAAEEFGRRTGSAMGVGYGAYAAAFVLGSSAAGFMIEAAGLRTPFAVYLGTALASVLLVVAMPGRRAASDADDRTRMEGSAGRKPLGGRGGRRPRLLAYTTGFVYVFGLGIVLSFLPAYAADRGFAPRAVGLLLGAYWVARLVGSVAAGRLSDRLGRAEVLGPVLLLSAASATLVAMPAGTVGLVVGAIGLGLAAGACAPTCVGLIADHAAPADRGIAMGLFEGACGLSFILSGFVGGHLAEAFDPAAPYLLAAALAAGWMPVLVRALPHRPRY
jgi:MFS family permease